MNGIRGQLFQFTSTRKNAFHRRVRAVERDAVAGEHMALRCHHTFARPQTAATRLRGIHVIGPVHATQPIDERCQGGGIIAVDFTGQQFGCMRGSRALPAPHREPRGRRIGKPAGLGIG